MAERGRLIAFEGIDGCGKTTQAHLLAATLGPRTVITSEPGATALGARLRSLLLDPQFPSPSVRAEALLMAADRAEHVAEVVGPALEDGRWVVTDRYSGSTLAYQGYGRNLDVGELAKLVAWATGGIQADMNVLVDVPLALSRERVRSRDKGDRLEQSEEDFHDRVRRGYLTLAGADDTRWVVIDGVGTVSEVAARVYDAITARMGPLPAGLAPAVPAPPG